MQTGQVGSPGLVAPGPRGQELALGAILVEGTEHLRGVLKEKTLMFYASAWPGWSSLSVPVKVLCACGSRGPAAALGEGRTLSNGVVAGGWGANQSKALRARAGPPQRTEEAGLKRAALAPPEPTACRPARGSRALRGEATSREAGLRCQLLYTQ